MQQLAKLWSRRFMGSIPIVPEREEKKRKRESEHLLTCEQCERKEEKCGKERRKERMK